MGKKKKRIKELERVVREQEEAIEELHAKRCDWILPFPDGNGISPWVMPWSPKTFTYPPVHSPPYRRYTTTGDT